MPISIAVGNGESRLGIDLDRFYKKVILIGCNALHRDHRVDHLICVDQRMVNEAIENPSTKETKIYTRPNWVLQFRNNSNVTEVPELPYKGTLREDDPWHWGSGPFALLLAAQLSESDVWVIGFDLHSKSKTVNNVYKGSKNYSAALASPVDPRYWIYQCQKVFAYFPNKRFFIFNEKNWTVPESWAMPNVILQDKENLSVLSRSVLQHS